MTDISDLEQKPDTPSILYVEDEEGNIELVRLILHKEFKVVGALSGWEGLEVVRREKPDLVLLDIMMPDMDGWQFYEHLKADSELSQIPIVIVSARDYSVDEVLGLRLPKVEGHITKPFLPSEIRSVVRDVLQGREWD